MLDRFVAPAQCMECVGDIGVDRCLAMTVASPDEKLERCFEMVDATFRPA